MSSTEAKRAMHEQKAEQHAAQASAKAGQATAAAGQSATEATQVRFEYSVCLYKPHGLFRRELFLLVVHPVRREGENSCFQVAQHALHTSQQNLLYPTSSPFLITFLTGCKGEVVSSWRRHKICCQPSCRIDQTRR